MVPIDKRGADLTCSHSYAYGSTQIFTCDRHLPIGEIWELDGQNYCLVHAPATATNGLCKKREFAQAKFEHFQKAIENFVHTQLKKIDMLDRVLDLSGLVSPIDCDLGEFLSSAGAMEPGRVSAIVLAHAHFGDYLNLQIPITLQRLILDDAVLEGRADLSGWRISDIRASRLTSSAEIYLSSPDRRLICDRIDLSHLRLRGSFICDSAYIFSSMCLNDATFELHSALTLTRSAAAQLSIAHTKFLGSFDLSRLRIAFSLNATGVEIAEFANVSGLRNKKSIAGALKVHAARNGLGQLDPRDYIDDEHSVDFRNSTFSSGISFTGSRFESAFDISINRRVNPELIDANFRSVTFDSDATFRNREFVGQSTFENSVFGKAPSFAGAKLSRDTTFSGAFFLDTSSREAEARYRLLRRELRDSESTDDYELFVRLETDSRWARRRELPLWETPVLFLFRNFFDYGADIGRAASVVMLNWIGGGSIYFIFGTLIRSHYVCRLSPSDGFCRVHPAGTFTVLLMALRVSAHAALIPFSFLPNWPDVTAIATGGHRMLLEWIVLAVGLIQSMLSTMLWISVAWAITWKISKD